MVLRPLLTPAPRDGVIPAWDAVEPVQKHPYSECWLIAQPDHAALAGDIAAHLAPRVFPGLDSDVLKGITLHDEGWGPFDTRAAEGRQPPRSFIDEAPGTFVEAWTASVDRCQEVAPIAAVIVSKHFCRLAQFRTGENKDTAENMRLLRGFLIAEDRRQRELLPGCRSYDPECLTDVLQFCDLLSLYLCCGAQENVTFPQSFAGSKVRLERVRTQDSAAICRFSPSILDGINELAVSARGWPDARNSRQVLFVLE